MRPLRAARTLAAAIVLTRLARGATRPPPLAPRPTEGRTVSVVIPARDEATRIGPCLAALVAHGEAHEIIVVDDESSDATAALARDAGAIVVDGQPRPTGWAGKPWALQQGIQVATGDWVVLLDADTRARPGLLGAAVGATIDGRHDLLTVAGRFVCDSPLEQIVHSSMLMTLVYRFGPPAPSSTPGRLLANGQCMVMEREGLLARGGFESVRASLIEDVAFARRIAHRGGSVGFVDGRDLLDVRMYESAASTWRDWGRSLALAEVTDPTQQWCDLAVLWLVMGLPLPRLLAGRADRVDLALLALRLAMTAAVSPSYTPQHQTRWLSLLADPLVLARVTQTTLRPERTWRGRTYD